MGSSHHHSPTARLSATLSPPTRTMRVCTSTHNSSATSTGRRDHASAPARASRGISRRAASASTAASSRAASHGSAGTGPRSTCTSSCANVHLRCAADNRQSTVTTLRAQSTRPDCAPGSTASSSTHGASTTRRTAPPMPAP